MPSLKSPIRLKSLTSQGGDTPYFGRVYSYPVFKIKDSLDLMGIHGALENFYQQELLARMYPNHGVGGELYEFNLLLALPRERKNPTDRWDRKSIIRDVAIVVAESKLNYGRRWARLASIVSDEFASLIRVYGSDLFLEVLKERCGRDFVENAYSIISKLPLEDGRGFAPPILHDIYRVLNELYIFFRHGKMMRIEEINRLGIGVTLKGESGGWRGKITIEKGPPIAFV